MACCVTTFEMSPVCVSTGTAAAETLTVWVGPAGERRSCTTETPPTSNSIPRLVRVAMPCAEAVTS